MTNISVMILQCGRPHDRHFDNLTLPLKKIPESPLSTIPLIFAMWRGQTKLA